jgi:hypothetical protein
MSKLPFLAGAAALALLSLPAAAQDHSGHDMSAGTPPGDEPMDHSRMDHSKMDHSAMGHGNPDAPGEGSGTARLPANESGHTGLHIDAGGGWMVMAHGFAWGVYSDQSGPRGDDKATIQSMLMLSGEKDTGWGRIQLKSMMSLEPLMSNRGYPNLFATGETAGGEPLVDRQHPHDLFMELAARIDIDVGDNGERLFLYGGPVGEPAIGPSAFMHRGSARYNPEAPITHHWFDSTHITYGVATLGYQTRRVQIEGSLFTGREPDEKRWNIEKPRFDSWAVRGTWTPTPSLALQASHAFLKQPELLHGAQNEHRTTASVQYANGKGLSATAAFSAKNRDPGETLTAYLAEVNWDLDDHHTLFGRIENVKNDELFSDHDDPLHDVPFRVTKFQAGYAYRIPITGPLNLAWLRSTSRDGWMRPMAGTRSARRSSRGSASVIDVTHGWAIED